jgi:hypothetical protein
VSRYVGTGDGSWHGAWFVYRPSVDDRLLARDYGERVAAARAGDLRTGYGPRVEARASWFVTGFLGEIAALHPIGSGPQVELWHGRGWQGRADYGAVEIRTTSTYQLRGGSPRAPGLGGWRVVAKDRGRTILAVQDRGDDLAVMGWALADDIPRLQEPLGRIVAVVDYSDLRPLGELYDRMRVGAAL